MNFTDRVRIYEQAFTELGGSEVVGDTQLAYVVDAITGARSPIRQSEITDLPVELDELASGFETLGIEQSRQGAAASDVVSTFDWAFRIRTGVLAEGVAPTLRDVWLLCASGIGSQNHPQLRDVLAEPYWDALWQDDETLSWPDRVLYEATHALFLLTRKRNGWADIDNALESLQSLTALQAEFEPEEFENRQNGSLKRYQRLLGVYHLAEALTIVGRYLRTGLSESVMPAVERHAQHARELLGALGEIDIEQIGEAAGFIFPTLIRASIWFNTARLSEAARTFAKGLAQRADNPVLELWWSQRQALHQNMLDPFKIAVGVKLPTSAGKTLLAEFSIVQTLALNPSSAIAYVVPTRALVTQITRRLRRDLYGAGMQGRRITVEAAVPVFELDPTESQLLNSRPDIIVTTPEKLDLLVRSGHPCIEALSLVVVDEAHHISEPDRGPRLELLLATIKRERGVSCRFLLLTPFMPNAEELARWLGEGAYAGISLDWQPSLQIRAIGEWGRKNKTYWDTLRLVPSATQPEHWNDFGIQLGAARPQLASRSRPALSTSIATALARNGSTTLVLTRGPAYAERRALAAAELASEPQSTHPLVQDVISYVAAELGENYPLVRTLGRGVAFHHAGVPPEVRSLVEILIDQGHIRVVTGTTTLAQGVDFPISSVVVESLTMPQGRGKPDRPLLHSEFWNIVGRAGRALKDRVGLVVWPAVSKAEAQEFREYLQNEASAIVSALLSALVSVEEVGAKYDLALVRRSPALGYFMQYLTHALRVAGYAQASSEVEDILRSSLVFHSLRRDDRDAAERLIRWSRGFLAATRDRGLLDVADSTGLSLPSVGLLAGKTTPEMRTREFWDPGNLFGDDLDALTEVVELLAEVPEMSLGITNEPGGINARRVARMLHGWVNGQTLPEIAHDCFPDSPETDSLRNAGRYLFRELTGQIPWGLGALQLIATEGRLAEDSPEIARIPAMAYYGVNSAEAVAMRMIGVPRIAAEVLGSGAPSFDSFEQARQWVESRPPTDWTAAGAPRGVSGSTLRSVWSLVT